MRARTYISLVLGKLLGGSIRLLKMGGGSNLPGRMAMRIDHQFIPNMVTELGRGSVLITGTNGKTTTANMLAGVLTDAGYPPVHNRSGANLLGGIASAIIRGAHLSGRSRGDIGLFEVDEATLPSAIEDTSPRIVLVNNLFRDQLDRYGELNTLARKMRKGLESLPRDTSILLNADDPLVAGLGRDIDRKVRYFGVESETYSSSASQHAADSKHCVICGSPYQYSSYLFGHMGKYHCPACGNERPVPQTYISEVELKGMEGTIAKLTFPGGEATIRLPLPGLYNLYNLLGAFSCALELGIEVSTIIAGIERFTAAFGRLERINVDGKTVHVILAKNPAGYNEVMRTLSLEKKRKYLVLALNDNIADGRDVSWIWDADLEALRDGVKTVVASGIRALDMALRVKYAELGEEDLQVESDLGRAFSLALEQVPQGEDLFIVPTYTAMLDLRKYLSKKGLVIPFWET